MEISEVKIGIKVVPTKKSYAQDLKSSQHWKQAREKGQNFLYVNFIHHSHTKGKIFVLGVDLVPNNNNVGDFFLAEDFERLMF